MNKIIKNKVILIFIFFTLSSSIKAQLSWSVNLTNSGTYKVAVITEDTIDDVRFEVSLISLSGSKNEYKKFVDSKHPQLFPGYIYYKFYPCDASINKVTGNFLTYSPFPHVELPSGLRAKIKLNSVPPSQEIPETGEKIILEEYENDEKIKFNLIDAFPIQIKCSNIQPIYKDLEDWLLTKTENKIMVEVTIINQPNNDGNYYYTAWGKSFLKKGIGSEGACRLTADPYITLLYSDRYYTVPDNPNNLSQRFAYNKGDIQIITLDMAGNAIISKSITWNYEETFSNVIRIGNLIYGINDKKMIILNLYKSK